LYDELFRLTTRLAVLLDGGRQVVFITIKFSKVSPLSCSRQRFQLHGTAGDRASI